MVKQYENNEIFNKTHNNPFCAEHALGLFGMLAKIQKDASKLEKKISRNTYVWIEKINDTH